MENNKSYRVRTNVGEDKHINIQINEDYDILEILSLKIDTEGVYKLHTSKYGCVVGRVLANGGIGVPNAKVSIFIKAEDGSDENKILYSLYPYTTTSNKNEDGIRYNLLTDEQINDCHQAVGTLPNKRLVLDDSNVLEVFDKYYKFTTSTNNSGDYMIMGVPVGNQTIHMDVDLSDIGFLSQKPIDMMYKGYNGSQFENPQRFKKDANLNNLSQVISQTTNVYVNPFWGDDEMGEISITRHDIDVDYKFEPTCIFMGSLVTDNSSNGFDKKCIPTPNMGRMDRLVTGSGTIEMIRKTIDDDVEEFAINGNELINGNGIWCYQIPMNLDYVTTDEYGNIVPSNDPNKGLPTRTRVRFRVSLGDKDSDESNNHLVKILVPNNPQEKSEMDYVFGTYTKDDENGTSSFRDLLWNNVYTVKSYIPRIQKGKNQRNRRFSGIKNVNVYGNNNPIPYNNMRVNITFMFVLQCLIVKMLLKIVALINKVMINIVQIIGTVTNLKGSSAPGGLTNAKCVYIGDGLCPDLDGWYFAPNCVSLFNLKGGVDVFFLGNTLSDIEEANGSTNLDEKSKDESNSDDGENWCLATNVDYFMQCIEINLAMEHEVIQFDFYNDWINGLLYLPRWFVMIKKKAKLFFGAIKVKTKIKACTEDDFKDRRRYTQQCSLHYRYEDGKYITTSHYGCLDESLDKKKYKCHKSEGRDYQDVFRGNGGIVHSEENYMGQNIYYAKPCEWNSKGKRCLMFATDIVLLGSINKNNLWGIPSDLGGLAGSTFQMPPNLAQTNMDSEGNLYAVTGSGYHLCSKGKEGDWENKNVETVERADKLTFDAYSKWTTNSNEDNPGDDGTEYAVTEMSGIDWGFKGPNQGGDGNFTHPGGHFLGIACTSSEVSIKSCVNLKRICELSATMSQRQSFGKFDNKSGTFSYTYMVPNGFISKLEIGENSYRYIFSTLNTNSLRSVRDEKRGITSYIFKPNIPTSFSGEFSKKVGAEGEAFIRPPFSDNELLEDEKKGDAFSTSIESTDSEYLKFRFGKNFRYENDTMGSFLSKKHLYNSGYMTMPQFENSFYFYFGLVNGSTSYDKFMSDYYASCPQTNMIVPDIIVGKKDCEVCNNGTGTVVLTLVNVPEPYRYKITKTDYITNSIGVESENDFMVGTEIVTNRVTQPTIFDVEVVNDKAEIVLKKHIYVDKIIGKDFPLNDTTIILNNGFFDNDTKVDMVTTKIPTGGNTGAAKFNIEFASVISYNEYKKGIVVDISKLETGGNNPTIKGFVIRKGATLSSMTVNDDGKEPITTYQYYNSTLLFSTPGIENSGAVMKELFGTNFAYVTGYDITIRKLEANAGIKTKSTTTVMPDSLEHLPIEWDKNNKTCKIYPWGVGEYIFSVLFSCPNSDDIDSVDVGVINVDDIYYEVCPGEDCPGEDCFLEDEPSV